MKKWKVKRIRKNVHIIDFGNVSAGWEQRVMISGDRHHDNIQSDHRLQKKHLEIARKINSPIIDIGDFFCLMQGRYDPRKSDKELRPEHIGDNYFDLVANTTEKFFAPYADLFAVIGYGNHESSVIRHNQTDMIHRITKRLQRNSKIKNRCYAGGYAGWVFLRCRLRKTLVKTVRIKYHHGSGGGGPVTKGTIQTNRRAVFIPDANIIATAHIHEAWIFPIKRERITCIGNNYEDIQWHINAPTYKNDYGLGEGGFHIEKGRPPKPMGCVWLKLRADGSDEIRVEPELDII